MRLTIIGCGDAFGSGGRHQTCFLLDHGGVRLMIDCGATALLAMKRESISLDSIDAILISHLHGDHFGGLPFLFLNAVFIDKRKKPLPIIGPRGTRQRFEALLESSYPGALSNGRDFDMPFHELEAGVETAHAGLKILPMEVRHDSGAPSLGFRIQAGGRTLAFSGDTGWCDSVVTLGRNADLYVIECSTYDTRLRMHLDYQTIAQHFDAIGARRYLLTHMSDEMLARNGSVNMEKCQMAQDGLVIDV
jgi:ribonuclease BN (tRNA processing enzyme)